MAFCLCSYVTVLTLFINHWSLSIRVYTCTKLLIFFYSSSRLVLVNTIISIFSLVMFCIISSILPVISRTFQMQIFNIPFVVAFFGCPFIMFNIWRLSLDFLRNKRFNKWQGTSLATQSLTWTTKQFFLKVSFL